MRAARWIALLIVGAPASCTSGNEGASDVPACSLGDADCSASSGGDDAQGVGGAATGGAVSGSGGSAGWSGSGGSGGAPASGGAAGDLCDAGVWDGDASEVLALTGNTFAHDPTMIEAGGVYYRFWTGDHIPSARSTDLRHWTSAPTVYGGSYPAWVGDWLSDISGQTFNFPWAPDVSYFGGRFHLYSSFSAKFGDNVSCIAHLSTPDIAAGNWTDHGPIFCTEGNEDFNAIDADVGLDESGTPWLSFGSFWKGIHAFELNQDGSRAGTDLTRLAWAPQIEAPVLFRRCGHYYLFVTWGLCCPGEGRSIEDLTYRVAVGRSENLLGPYLDKNGTPLLEGGGTLVVEGDGVEWAAAGHSDVVVGGGQIHHVYHAYRQSNGAAQLRIAELSFDEDGWPVQHAP